MEFSSVDSVDLISLTLGSDIWKSSGRELELAFSVLKLADGWLLVLSTSGIDSTTETAEAAELLSHTFARTPT